MRDLPPAGASLRDVIFAVRQLIMGRSNSVGDVTLTANTTTTTIALETTNENAKVFLFPQTANAATELGNGTIRASISRIAGVPTVTITHANNAQVDRTFSYDIRGG
jgi:hypothetical protein